MKRFFMTLLAVFFPWLLLLLEDNPGGAVVALVLQASIIGWPVASYWALRSIKRPEQSDKPAQK